METFLNWITGLALTAGSVLAVIIALAIVVVGAVALWTGTKKLLEFLINL